MPTRENRDTKIRHGHERLWQGFGQGARMTRPEYETMIEAGFRLAVHRRTVPPEALALLHRIHRLDGTDPRYPYHLGRMYPVHGWFDRAAEWLGVALDLSPTSHRIWSDLAVTLRELDQSRREQLGFAPGAFRHPLDLADFTPPPPRQDHGEPGEDENRSDTARINRATTCRWTGVHDIRIELLP